MVAEGSMLASKKDHIVYLSNSLRASWWGIIWCGTGRLSRINSSSSLPTISTAKYISKNLRSVCWPFAAQSQCLLLASLDPLLRDLSVQTVLHRPQLLAWNKESIKVSFVHLNWSHKVWRYILDSWILKNLCYKHVLSFILPRNVVLSWVILRINSYLG